MSLNVGLSYFFSFLFVRAGWMPHGGLALANSLATFLEMGALLFFMRRRLMGIEGRRVFAGFAQALCAGGVMALALWGWLGVTKASSSWLTALGGIVIGGLAYGLMLFLLRVPEVNMVVRQFYADYHANLIEIFTIGDYMKNNIGHEFMVKSRHENMSLPPQDEGVIRSPRWNCRFRRVKT